MHGVRFYINNMGYHIEKGTNDIVIDSWEQGIASSPHKGIANMQAVNIATESGEVMCSFARSMQINSTSIQGTLTYYNSTTLSISYTSGSGLKAGMSIYITAGITGLASGTYFINTISALGTSLTLRATYQGAIVSGMSAGSATFSNTVLGSLPVATATENYYDTSNVAQNRYYILDSNGFVWVYDTALNTSNNWDWFLPYANGVSTYSGGYITSALNGGIAVLNGWLGIVVGNNIFWRPTSNLDATPTSVYSNMLVSPYNSSNPHYAFVGHENIMYYTDGYYIGSIFPNTSLITQTINIQSYCSYTIDTQYRGLVSAVISGSSPSFGANSTVLVPAIFYPATGGTLPTAILPNVIYFIKYPYQTNVVSNGFYVYDQLGNQIDIQTGASGTTFYFNTFNPVQTIRTQFALTAGVSVAATTATLLSSWAYPTGTYTIYFSDGEFRSVTLTSGSTAVSWSVGITNGSGVLAYIYTAVGNNMITFTPMAVSIPINETAKCIAEIGNNILIGCTGNVVYPWNQQDPNTSDMINLPERNVSSIITVNNMGYIFAGNKGNIYITNGSAASAVISVPDYCAGIAGTPSTYIEPYFIWGGSMYLKGRVYFSIKDQTVTKAGNCGGIWSFIPTQNMFFGQDVGLALRLENQASYGNYNGYSTLLIPAQNQLAIAPQYWNAWFDGTSGYGIDFTGTTTSTPATIEMDLIPTGTMLEKQTFKQIEYKLSTPLAVGESVAISYRQNSTASYATCGTINTESTTPLSGYYNINFEKGQWLQLQAVLTPLNTSSSSFCRLMEIRVR